MYCELVGGAVKTFLLSILLWLIKCTFTSQVSEHNCSAVYTNKLTLSCNVETEALIWRHNGSIVTTTPSSDFTTYKISEGTHNLVLTNIKLDASGVYTCSSELSGTVRMFRVEVRAMLEKVICYDAEECGRYMEDVSSSNLNYSARLNFSIVKPASQNPHYLTPENTKEIFWYIVSYGRTYIPIKCQLCSLASCSEDVCYKTNQQSSFLNNNIEKIIVNQLSGKLGRYLYLNLYTLADIIGANETATLVYAAVVTDRSSTCGPENGRIRTSTIRLFTYKLSNLVQSPLTSTYAGPSSILLMNPSSSHTNNVKPSSAVSLTPSSNEVSPGDNGVVIAVAVSASATLLLLLLIILIMIIVVMATGCKCKHNKVILMKPRRERPRPYPRPEVLFLGSLPNENGHRNGNSLGEPSRIDVDNNSGPSDNSIGSSGVLLRQHEHERGRVPLPHGGGSRNRPRTLPELPNATNHARPRNVSLEDRVHRSSLTTDSPLMDLSGEVVHIV